MRALFFMAACAMMSFASTQQVSDIAADFRPNGFFKPIEEGTELRPVGGGVRPPVGMPTRRPMGSYGPSRVRNNMQRNGKQMRKITRKSMRKAPVKKRTVRRVIRRGGGRW